jgi:tRNA(Ile)-lysidine synthase TilS/MesJ
MAMDATICKKCALDSGIPGITINAETGLCQFCENYSPVPEMKKDEFRLQMDTLFASPSKQGKYDVIMALSGGIDSSYALYRLKKEYPHLKVLAVQFDNGFISGTAFENAQKFCQLTKSTYFRLVLDNDLLRDIFKKAASSKDAYTGFAKYRASDMCNTCMSIIKQKIVEMAVLTKTPYIVFAFSPGQTEVPFVTLTKPFMSWIRKLFDGQLKTMGVKERNLYLMDQETITASPPDTSVMIIHPFLVWGYNKPQFRQECIQLGWSEPDLKDPNSSNCLLNAYAIQNHFDKYHIHSYAYDLSALVRQGNMKKEEAMKTLNTRFPETAIEEVRRRLDLSEK